MRQSVILLPTLKEDPANADVISHRLMLRAGLIRQAASGLYSWLPLGLRTLRKIEKIIREELNASGAQELLMPVVQPAELWQESGRWEKMGPEMLKMQDRHERDFCLGPTHEEVVTDIFRREIQSYRQLPVNFYQIQTKFRDERRPRFGVMRAREFMMKDGYSFHADQASFDATYAEMYDCYGRVLKRMQLNYRAVLADTGNIGGKHSHEFHVLAESGEDTIVYAANGDYAANLEKAVAAPLATISEPIEPLEKVPTPGATTIEAVSSLLNKPPQQSVKTLFVKAETGLLAIVLRGDHTLNEVKAEKLPGVLVPLEMADEADVKRAMGCPVGSLGPLQCDVPFVVDQAATALNNFVCGANEEGVHYTGANWDRDCSLNETQIVDARNVVEGDLAIENQGELKFQRGIEVGHIFQLGTTYSEAMGAQVLDQDGGKLTPLMGCYGLGVTRLVAAIVEQNHDSDGITWPEPVAPFLLHIIPLNAKKSTNVAKATEQLYQEAQAAGIEVLIDDRDERPGVKFADADLVGIPHRLVVGDRGLADGQVEYKHRGTGKMENLSLSNAIATLRERLSH